MRAVTEAGRRGVESVPETIQARLSQRGHQGEQMTDKVSRELQIGKKGIGFPFLPFEGKHISLPGQRIKTG